MMTMQRRTHPITIVCVMVGATFMLADAYRVYRPELALLFAPKSLYAWANVLEGWFWIGAGLAIAARAQWWATPSRRSLGIAAFILVLFGVSDFVESRTGAWWRPWWLFVWKAACVLALCLLLAAARRRRGRNGIEQSAAGAVSGDGGPA